MKSKIIKYKSILKGLLTFFPFINTSYDSVSNIFNIGKKKKVSVGIASGRYCYSVWLRHLVLAHENDLNVYPKTVAELGPGSSIGVGLAALLSGANKYYAFDVIEYASLEKNLMVFDELISLFEGKEDIPDNKEFPNLKPMLNDFNFPKNILTDERLKKSLRKDRIDSIRETLKNLSKGSSYISYKVPWFDPKIVRKGSIDFIFSQATLEHVEDLKNTYAAMNLWLNKNGCISHQIDFKSHGISFEWNGHWTFDDFTWKLMKGKRLYFINRLTCSDHIKIIEDNNFLIKYKKVVKIESEVERKNLSKRFKSISNSDLNTSGLFFQAIVSNI